MSRYVFGGKIQDFAFGTSGSSVTLLSSGVPVTFYTAATGGTQITDLQDMSGNAISTVGTTANGFLPQFQGPDSTGSLASNANQMWASVNGSSTRYQIFGAHAGSFDPLTSSYNNSASKLRRTRAALGRAAAPAASGAQGNARILILGDSRSDNCDYSGAGSGGAYNNTLTMWPVLLRNNLCSLSGAPKGGSGFIKASGVGVQDPRLTIYGTWTDTPSGYYAYSATLNDVIQFDTTVSVSGETGTTVAVVYNDYQTSTWSISVDGATSGAGFAAMTNTNTGQPKVKVLTGLSNTAHTIAIKPTAANYVFLHGVSVLNPGLTIDNFAIDGGTSAMFTSSGTINPIIQAYYTGLGYQPDLVIHMNGINDINTGGLTAAQVAANYTAIKNLWPSSDYLALGEYTSNVQSEATWQGLLAALYGAADSAGFPLIDLYDRYGTYATANSLHMMGDGTHGNQVIQRDMATLLTTILRS